MIKKTLNTQYRDNSHCPLTVAQWNITNCKDDVLDWQNRRKLVLDELSACKADIIGLQEVEAFEDIQSILLPFEYLGYFKKKPDRNDGLAVFYHHKKLEIVNVKEYTFQRKQHHQIALLILFKVKQTGRKVLFVCTHLKAKEGFEKIRFQQIMDLTWNIMWDHNDSVIICGDLNDVPGSLMHTELKGQGYKSVYPDDAMTTYKKRENVEVKRVSDYIWYSGNIIPFEYFVPENLESYPSDHLLLTAGFYLKNTLNLKQAIRTGNLSYVKKKVKRNNPCNISKRQVKYAAKCGHLHIMKWLINSQGARVNKKDILHVAAQKGYLDIVKYTVEKLGAHVTGSVLLAAAGNKEVEDYLESFAYTNVEETIKVNEFFLFLLFVFFIFICYNIHFFF